MKDFRYFPLIIINSDNYFLVFFLASFIAQEIDDYTLKSANFSWSHCKAYYPAFRFRLIKILLKTNPGEKKPHIRICFFIYQIVSI
jgi:hypothetical protein